jgi:hypothetical protein
VYGEQLSFSGAAPSAVPGHSAPASAGPPNTLFRATEIVLRALAEVPGSDLSALHVLCDSDDPPVAGIANGVASYVWESDNDLDRALKAASRMLTAFDHREGWYWCGNGCVGRCPTSA